MAGVTPSIERLQKKVEKEPNPGAFLQLAEEYRKEGMLHEALKVCQDGLKRHPNYWSTRVSLGRVYYELGQSEQAREELEKVVKAVPDNLLANRILGDIYFNAHRLDEALKRYKLVQMLSPSDQEVAGFIQKIESQQSGRAPQPKAPAVGPGSAFAEVQVLSRESTPAAPTLEIPAATAKMPVPELPVAAPVMPVPEVAAAEPPIPALEPEPVPAAAPTQLLPRLDLENTSPGVPIFTPEPVASTEVPAEAPVEEPSPELAQMADAFLESSYSNEMINSLPPQSVAPEIVPLPSAEGMDFPVIERRTSGMKSGDITQPIEPEEIANPEADELNTQTLAELYVQQGHIEKAIKVFQKLLLNDPNNTQIQSRLKELNPADALVAPAVREEREKAGTRQQKAREERQPEPAALKSRLQELSDDRRRKITTLESWLTTIRRERS